ncbi:cyclin-like protein [Mycena albidolilacea]|uniref:Cyclin-like protein n=1 Tax=Mycena albidolilacea TaxID=1033008 RepID=A0AAD7AVA9_9AGAR|nr:cyclin-like protein [Mycena albidolilacea]
MNHSQSSRGQSPTPHSSSKYHHPYFTPAEVDYLSEKQRGKLSVTQEERVRQNACAFLETLGARIGFPRRTIATAQNLYHRFHLFFPRKDFNYVDVSLASMYVSTKMHDTLKKPRELLAVSYAIRFPDLVAKSKHPGGQIDVDTMDQQVVERDRQRVLAIERLLLETICFNFTSRMPFPYVIKLGKAFGASKKLTKLAWRLTIDCHRTLVPIQYPPHIVALANLYVGALLSSFEQPVVPEDSGTRTPHEIAQILGNNGDWEQKYQAQVDDLEGIAHTVIDLLIQGAQSATQNTSPRTPSSPSPHPSPRTPHPLIEPQAASVPYNADQLIRLKIAMRQTEHSQRVRQPLGNADPSALYSGDDVGLLGRNEGTVRFLFGPPDAGDEI